MADTELPPRAPICFVDTETDGTHPGRQPWEVALIHRAPDGREHERVFYIEINLGDTPDGFGLGVGRFQERHPLGRYLSGREPKLPEPSDVGDYLTREAAAFAVARATYGAYIVGSNPSFDTFTLEPLLRAHGLLPFWPYHTTCVRTLATGFLAARGEPRQPPWKSTEIGASLGVVTAEDEKHTALGDARFAMHLYDAIMAGGPAVTTPSGGGHRARIDPARPRVRVHDDGTWAVRLADDVPPDDENWQVVRLPDGASPGPHLWLTEDEVRESGWRELVIAGVAADPPTSEY